MASTGDGTLPTGSHPDLYLGHPQPPPDERLQAAFNFLADEDPDRCLDFDSMIVEIEAYVKHLEDHKIPCSAQLLKDVQTMAATHRDWEQSRNEPPADTTCDESQRARRISPRLICVETAQRLRAERQALGTIAQARHDYAPFSVFREHDHGDFIHAMKEDAAVDPDELNSATGLVTAEARAYNWTLLDPIMIPYWMDPTNGIPKKGISPADPTPWYRQPVPDPAGAHANRPVRVWVPAYLLATEARINVLLAHPSTTVEEYRELEDLLLFLEPPEVRQLHLEMRAYDDEELALTALFSGVPEESSIPRTTFLHPTASERKRRDQVAQDFRLAYGAWRDTFTEVYLVVRLPRQTAVEVPQPGVFFVDHAILNSSHRNVLQRANKILQSAISGGLTGLSPDELAAFALFSQHSESKGVTAWRRAQAALLRYAGVNSANDLEGRYKKSWDDLCDGEMNGREAWFADLADLNPEFRYLRPGEMEARQPNILYIPYEMNYVPTRASPILIELGLSSSAREMELAINDELTKTRVSSTDGKLKFFYDRGILKFVEVFYPLLRELAQACLRYDFLVSVGESLTPEDVRLRGILAPIMGQRYEAWRYGLGQEVIVKMPHPDQVPEHPGIIYCRKDLAFSGDDRVDLTHRIQSLVDLGYSRNLEEQTRLESLLRTYQYPALQSAYTAWQVAERQGVDQKTIYRLRETWQGMSDRWVRSMEGSTITIKSLPDPRVDPDNDPRVVYYRGPLSFEENYLKLDETVRKEVGAHLGAGKLAEDFVPSHPDLFPDHLRAAFDRWQRSGHAEYGALYAYHLQLLWQGSQPKFTPDVDVDVLAPEAVAGVNGPCPPECPTPAEPARDARHPARARRSQRRNRLGIDIAVMERVISDLENDINNLVRSISLTTEYPERKTLLRILDGLLKQFVPCDIHTLQVAARAQHTGLSESDLVLLRHHSALRYQEWRRPILRNGVMINRYQRTPKNRSEQLISFMPHATGRGEDFAITLRHQVDKFKTRTYRYRDYARPVSDPTAHSRRDVVKLQSVINSLLRKQSLTANLDWDESEILLAHLRTVMPEYLRNMDKAHTLLDRNAREKAEPEKHEDFWLSWDNWNKTYLAWIQSFPGGQVTIATTTDANDSATMPVTERDISDSAIRALSEPKRPTVLPHAVKSMEDDLNDYLYGDFASLSVEDRQKRDTALWDIFGHILGDLRGILLARIQNTFETGKLEADQLTAEVAALYESLALRACTLYREELRQLPSKKLSIVEAVPGQFTLSYGSSPVALTELDSHRTAERLADQLFVDEFKHSWKEFLEIASKVRRFITLTAEEHARLELRVGSLSTENLKSMQIKSDVIARILIKYHKNKTLERHEKEELVAADQTCIWYRWALNSLDPALRVLLNPPLPDVIDRLIAGGAGSLVRSREVPPVVMPSEFDVKELEVEINNLLFRRNMGSVDGREAYELSFIIRELLPPSLRAVKQRIDGQGKGTLSSADTVHEGLAALEAQRHFNERYEEYLDQVSVIGIILDHWWYSQETISAACSRWRGWKQVHENPDGSLMFPQTSRQLEDSRQRQMFQIYAALVQYVDTDLLGPAPANVALQSLLGSLPGTLVDLKEEVRKTASYLVADDLDGERFLLQIKEEFIKSFLDWYISLTPQALAQKMSNGAQSNTIDFTSKAERRGIQRAAIELALNLLATNQEQHRPADRFRLVALDRQFVPLPGEVSISLPLEASTRQVEHDTFGITKKIIAYREWKESDHEIARERVLQDPSVLALDGTGESRPDSTTGVPKGVPLEKFYLKPPANYMGPIATGDAADWIEFRKERHAVLSRVATQLSDAYAKAPRPLLQKMLERLNDGMRRSRNDDDHLPPPEKKYLELLQEVAGESWDESRRDYTEHLPHLSEDPAVKAQQLVRLAEFEKTLALVPNLPFWDPLEDDPGLDRRNQCQYPQYKYTPSVRSQLGMSMRDLHDELGKITLQQGLVTWTVHEMRLYLRTMKDFGRIHFDEFAAGLAEQVSRIPLAGHPENKYVTSTKNAQFSNGVRRLPDGKLEVTYNARGDKGPLIVQPNKETFLPELAFRLGRDIVDVLEDLRAPQMTSKEAAIVQMRAANLVQTHMSTLTAEDRGQKDDDPSVDTSQIDLKLLAREALSTSPGLVTELDIDDVNNMSDRQAAAVIQTKTLQELSDNFEPKFWETNDIWGFASDRLIPVSRVVNGRTVTVKPRPRQYFSMMRFPVGCQSQVSRTVIESEGPIVQTRTRDVVPPLASARARHRPAHDVWEVNHIKGYAPHYPFGETPFQETYLSHVMEYELKDVPEFQPPQPTYSWYDPRRYARRNTTAPDAITTNDPDGADVPDDLDIAARPHDDDDADFPGNPYPLPKIHWTPQNISAADLRQELIEAVQRVDGFPQVPEHYYTSDEVARRDVAAQFSARRREIDETSRATEQLAGKKLHDMTREELRHAQARLGINPFDGTWLPDPPPPLAPTTPEVETARASLAARIKARLLGTTDMPPPPRPAIRTRRVSIPDPDDFVAPTVHAPPVRARARPRMLLTPAPPAPRTPPPRSAQDHARGPTRVGAAHDPRDPRQTGVFAGPGFRVPLDGDGAGRFPTAAAADDDVAMGGTEDAPLPGRRASVRSAAGVTGAESGSGDDARLPTPSSKKVSFGAVESRDGDGI